VAVDEHGSPLVDLTACLEGVAAFGLNESSFVKATRVAPTRCVTGLVEPEARGWLERVADRT
jgi:hypothetical protein